MSTTISLDVSFGQLSVFTSSLSQPFNDWTDRHVSQGFAWREGSVSFRTVIQAGLHVAEVSVVDHVGAVAQDAIRAIEVPFIVPADGELEIGSISETIPISMPAGSFLLRCEFLRSSSSEANRVKLTFARKDRPRFAVVLADRDLAVGDELLTDAKPAA